MSETSAERERGDDRDRDSERERSQREIRARARQRESYRDEILIGRGVLSASRESVRGRAEREYRIERDESDRADDRDGRDEREREIGRWREGPVTVAASLEVAVGALAGRCDDLARHAEDSLVRQTALIS